MLVIKRLRLALKSVPLIILFCKAYLGRIGLRPVFSSSFFPQYPLRMELIWFCPMLKDETMPNPNSWCFLTNMGIRVLLNTLPQQQLSIVSHAKLVLSIIKFSKRVFFSCRSSKNLRNYLLELLHETGKPFDVESLIGLIHWRSEVIVELKDTASSFGGEGKVLNKFSHTARNSCLTASFRISPDLILHFSYMNRLVRTILATCGRASSRSSSLESLPLKNSLSLAFRW